jgi:predicted branched-subunit amino acid permease
MEDSLTRSDRLTRQIALGGVRDALGLASITICFSLVGIGGLARDVGYPMLAGALSSALMWAGPAQVLLFGSIAAGTALPLAAIAILFSSLRFFPMTMAIMPLLNEPRRPIWQLLLAAHLVSITNWVEGMRRLPDLPAHERYPYFCGFGLTVLFSLNLAAPARRALDWLPIVLSVAIILVAPHTPLRDYDLIVAGVIGGTLAYIVQRKVEARAGVRP